MTLKLSNFEEFLFYIFDCQKLKYEKKLAMHWKILIGMIVTIWIINEELGTKRLLTGLNRSEPSL
jgi:hypothetical protein